MKRTICGFCAVLTAFSLTACTSSNASKEPEVTTKYVTVSNDANGKDIMNKIEEGATTTEEAEKSERKTYPEGYDERSRALNLKYRKDAYIVPVVRMVVNRNTEIVEPLTSIDTTMSYSVTSYTEEEKIIYKTILEAVKRRENSIDIPRTTTVTMERLRRLMVDMYLAEPEAYIIDMDSLNFKVEPKNSKYELFGLTYDYAYPIDDIKLWDSQINTLVSKLKSFIPSNASEYDLYLFLHDFVVYNVTYNEMDNEHNSDIVGALIKGYGTCQAFAHAYTYLCKEFGLYATNINGLSGEVGHMWNAIHYQGEWLTVDVGMDNVDNRNVLDWAPHGFFGVSQEFMESAKHTYYDENDMYYLAYPSCNTDKYTLYERQGWYYGFSDISNEDTFQSELLYIVSEAFKKDPDINYVEFVTSAEDLQSLKELYFYKGSTFPMDFGDNLEILLHTLDLKKGQYISNVAFVGQDWNNSVIIYIQFK